KASGGVKLLWDFFSQANSYSDEELARRLVFGELEMFILQDAYRQARSRYELAAASEPELVRALDAARHRLRLAATRVFVDEGGAVQDLGAPIRLGHVTGDLRVAVTVSTARVPFLVEVVAEGGEVLATATGPVGSQVTAIAAIPADTLAHALDQAHRLEVSIRVSSTNPG